MFGTLQSWLGQENYRATILVASGGLIGGIGAVLIQFLGVQPNAPLPPSRAMIVTIAAGPIAALIATLFILNTDRRDTLRLLLVAIVCGLSGPSILVTGANLGLKLVSQTQLVWDAANGSLVQEAVPAPGKTN